MNVDASVSLKAAATRVWDAMVVGAGPAGALAARELARRDLAVLLVDRASFPRFKVCGGCLNGRALGVLTRAGLGDLPAKLGAVEVRTFRLAAGGRQAQVKLAAQAAISRTAFDAALVAEAIGAGAMFLPRTQGDIGEVAALGRSVRLRGSQGETQVRARVVLAATGLARAAETAPASRLGAGVLVGDPPAFYRPGTIFMACGRIGYVGLVRVEDGRLDVAAALVPAALKECGGLGPAAQIILEEAGFPPPPGLADLDWKGTPLLTRRTERLAEERLFVLGDAAGYVEPFTGEGMAWALAGAVAVAPLAARAAKAWTPELADEWQRVYRQTVLRRQRVCRWTAGVLRRPALTRAIVRLLAFAPSLAAPFVQQMNE